MTRWACSIFVVAALGCDFQVTDPSTDNPLDWQDGSAAEEGGDTCAPASTGKGCAPECVGTGCSSASTAHPPSETRPSEVEPVPACPALARTTGLPLLFFHTEIASYEGPGTVQQRTDSNTLVLVLNDMVGDPLELRFNEPLPEFLPLGRRVDVELRSGGSGSGRYRLLVLRDDDDRLLLVSYGGNDRLYQEGVFSDAAELGFSVDITMICQSSVEDGCFENQVQADYAAAIRADDEVATDGSSPVQLHIEGLPYEVSFWSMSVDGGKRSSDCPPEIEPGRSIALSLIRR